MFNLLQNFEVELLSCHLIMRSSFQFLIICMCLYILYNYESLIASWIEIDIEMVFLTSKRIGDFCLHLIAGYEFLLK